jgi:hypothetical protein
VGTVWRVDLRTEQLTARVVAMKATAGNTPADILPGCDSANGGRGFIAPGCPHFQAVAKPARASPRRLSNMSRAGVVARAQTRGLLRVMNCLADNLACAAAIAPITDTKADGRHDRDGLVTEESAHIEL